METTGEPLATTPDVDVALYRVTQESLTNVAKHAEASRAVVTLSYIDDAVALDVVDDGHGFDPADVAAPSADGGGFGLVAMRQRVEQLRGRLQVESSPDRGTAVSAVVPVRSTVGAA